MHNVTPFESNYLGLDSKEFAKLELFTSEQRTIAWLLISIEYFVQFINIPFGIINIRLLYCTEVGLIILFYFYYYCFNLGFYDKL